MFGWTDRRPVRQEPAPAARHRPPDRHVRVPRAHRLQLSEDRRGVRWPRPHHRHARVREDPGPDGGEARGVRAGQRARSTGSSTAPVDNAVDDWGQCTARPGTTGDRHAASTCSLWKLVDNAVRTQSRVSPGTNAWLSTIHRPYYYDDQEFQLLEASEEAVVKFRCERDTLADAVATAQRTVASRSGALPCSRISGSPRPATGWS